MDFAWKDSDVAFRQRLRDFLDDMLPDRWHADYALKGPGSRAMMAFAKDFVPKMADAGLLTRPWPQEYGGEESTPWDHTLQNGRGAGGERVVPSWEIPVVAETVQK